MKEYYLNIQLIFSKEIQRESYYSKSILELYRNLKNIFKPYQGDFISKREDPKTYFQLESSYKEDLSTRSKYGESYSEKVFVLATGVAE